MLTEQLIESVGKKYGLTYKESNDLFQYYWKEFILKNLCYGDYENLHILNIGKFRYSSKKLKSIKNSNRRVKSDEFNALLDKLILEIDTSNNKRKWKK